MAYTAFIGCWNDGEPDWVHLREDGLTWEQARDIIKARLDRFANDTCEHCRDDAAEGAARLAAAKPGPFEWNVEGDEYLILVNPSQT